MDHNERGLIDGLFGKLRQAEQATGQRDAQAEQVVREHLAKQPAAPYYMAQAIIVQEHALNAAQERISQLEREVANRPAAGGGFLGGLFGGATSGAAGGRVPPPVPSQQMQQLHRYQQPGMGGSFLGGALQTAMGVAGGVVLGSILMDAFSADPAAAAETAIDDATSGFLPSDEEALAGEDAFADSGFDEEV